MPADPLTAAVVAAAEAVHLRDLAGEALPCLQRAVGASNALLYRYREGGVLEGVGGSLRDELGSYSIELGSSDPLQRLPRTMPPGLKIVMVTREVDNRAYRRSDAYHHFYRPHDMEHVVCAWMTGDRLYGEPGMTGILLARAGSQQAFSDREARALHRALPAFAAAARRSARVEATEGRCVALDAVVTSAVTRPLVAFAATGRVLWMSPTADELLGGTRGVPAGLADAARRLGALCNGERSALAPSFAGTYTVARGASIRAEFRLARTMVGELVVTAELEVGLGARERTLMTLGDEFELTRAETEVLGVLSRGLSNREIAARLFVSVETVRTHVARILHKLGVATRTQAALVVRERGGS